MINQNCLTHSEYRIYPWLYDVIYVIVKIVMLMFPSEIYNLSLIELNTEPVF